MCLGAASTGIQFAEVWGLIHAWARVKSVKEYVAEEYALGSRIVELAGMWGVVHTWSLAGHAVLLLAR